MKVFGLIATLALVSGCATKAVVTEFDNNTTLQVEFDDAWERVISFFAENAIQINAIEKESGLITAEYELITPKTMDQLASCTDPALMTASLGSGSFNVFVRKVNSGVKIQVNTTYSMVFTGPYNTTTIESCFSRGTLETHLLEYVRSPLSD